MKNKGFTILEFLITTVIMAIIMGAIYYTYANLFKKSRTEIYYQESELEKNIGLELLRLDIEHAGFGISSIEECPSLRWGNAFPLPPNCDDDLNFPRNVLVIRSMINNADTTELGWVFVDCSTGNWPTSPPLLIDERFDKTNNKLIFIDASTGNFEDIGTFGICPNNRVYLAYPYQDTTNMDNCKNQIYCHRIVYKIALTSSDDTCHPNTRNLIRGIDGTSGSGGYPVISCVGDFKILVDIDIDNDGISDMEYQEYNLLDINNNGVVDASEIMRALKRVHVYILMQVGKKDPKYNFPKTKLTLEEPTGTVVEFDLPSVIGTDYQYYRWKIFKISVNPMNLSK
ncbi:MAG: prepilin-type N-terminal cleavage/methylation domain-containing protein [Aquificae bacterium]|nr:prepilin-type N-terminal cleavage/methylation domain-containing protein [Aquificota bacterium]